MTPKGVLIKSSAMPFACTSSSSTATLAPELPALDEPVELEVDEDELLLVLEDPPELEPSTL
jgi:hypothetical protein